ncbi:MAG TPA: hypothetical protein VLL54_06660 [Pyrinomonadaceae bacterium]|nr:hypothetical protein [Pyrinomonadaceae bacterium]
MNIYNNTSTEVFYDISYTGSGDCGTIAAGDTAEWPAYDNQTDVRVAFTGVSGGSIGITLENTGEGKVLTVGLYSE